MDITDENNKPLERVTIFITPKMHDFIKKCGTDSGNGKSGEIRILLKKEMDK